MKIKRTVTRDRRKNRKRHFAAPAHIRRKIMSCRLSRELREEYKVKTIPIRRDDEVVIFKGKNKDFEGKVTKVDRRNFVVYIDGLTKEKKNGETYNIGVPCSKLIIKGLKMNGSRKVILDRKKKKE